MPATDTNFFGGAFFGGQFFFAPTPRGAAALGPIFRQPHPKRPDAAKRKAEQDLIHLIIVATLYGFMDDE